MVCCGGCSLAVSQMALSALDAIFSPRCQGGSHRHSVLLGISGLLTCIACATQVRMDRPDPASYWGRLAARLDISNPEHLVLLDVGMVAELTPDDQAHLVHFFKVLLP